MVLSRRNCKLSSRLLALYVPLLAFAPERPAHAMPAPPATLRKPTALVRVQIGSFQRFSVHGTGLVLNEGIHFAGSSVFNLRCGTDGNGGSYVEFGAGRRSLGKLEIFSSEGLLRINDRPYRSRLTIYPRGSACIVVNTLELEKYLAGLITREMMPSWPLEALKAQAVASRSYALYQMQANRAREYDLESSTQDQVYDGAGSETARSVQAVEQTRGQVLTYDGSPLKAYFHANCGGMTEVPTFVWGGEAKAFRPVVCPFHQRPRDRQQWRVHVTGAQVEHALKKISGLLPRGFFRLAALEAGAPDASRRLSDVVVSDVGGNNLLVSANTFRNAIGNTKVKSTAFQIAKEKNGYAISGEGFGHGVGLCQVGARAMADEGRKFAQILAYYYPLAKIRSL